MPNQQETPLVTSSREPEFDETQRAFFRAVLHQLNEREIPYTVSGAFALHHHTGIWRGIKDLDIFVTAGTVPRALATLDQPCFRQEITDDVWLAKVHCGEFYADFITGMSNGALAVTPEWIYRGTPSHLLDVPARILAAEELLVSKLFVVRRERFDGADIAHILYRTAGRLDWDRIVKLVGDHWELLFWALVLFRYVYPAQSHFVPAPVWADLTDRFRSGVDAIDPLARFRGSLVDEHMFAIDVHEWGMDDLMSENRARARKIHADAASSLRDSSGE